METNASYATAGIARECLVVRVLGSRLGNRCRDCDDDDDKFFAKFRDKLLPRTDNGIVSVAARACSKVSYRSPGIILRARF